MKLIRTLCVWAAFASCGFTSANDEFPTPVNTQAAGEHPPSPQEMLELFELPPGFKVTLFAGEPDVQQPICFDFDDTGRLWVAENYTYSAHGKIDPNLRDRVVILHDKDGDGQHDERKVFWDKGSMLTSLTWGYGGLWILNDGTLSFIPDKNGDDIPDSEPVEMLNGWTKNAGHNFVNGLMWGPDGWLYGRHGITDTSYPGTPDTPQAERQPINCGIWRFHPIKHTFEVVCHGTTNPWGLDYNEVGDMFMSNNVIGHLWHVIPGAHYERMFGQDFNPHCYELMGPISDHYHWDNTGKWSESRDGKADDLGGGHSHCGLMLYYGQNFPKEYWGKAFMCNTHGRCVNVDRIERKGSSYVAKHEPNFLKVNTPWFRGVQLAYGPAGCMYLSDWSDNGECHDHDGVHRTSGRIYRISYGEVKAEIGGTIAEHSARDLTNITLSSDNSFFARRARRLLFERITDNASVTQHKPSTDEFWEELGYGSHELPSARDEWPTMWSDCLVSEQEELASLEILAWAEALDEEVGRRFLSSRYESVQALAVRTILADSDLLKRFQKDLAGALRTNDSTVVALAFASAVKTPLRRSYKGITMEIMETGDPVRRCATDILFELTSVTRTASLIEDDETLRLMTWYAVNETRMTALFCEGAESNSLNALAYRRRYESTDLEDHERVGNDLEAMAKAGYTRPLRLRMQLEAILLATQGRKIAMPRNWNAIVTSLERIGDPEIDELTRRLGGLVGSSTSIGQLHKIVSERNGDHATRSRSIRALSLAPKSESIPLFLSLLNDRAVYVDICKALAAFDDDPRIPAELLKRWNDLRHGAKEAAMDTMISRKSYAIELMKALNDGRVSSDELAAVQVRQLLAFNDADIKKIVEAKWGVINESSADKEAKISELKQKLLPDVLAAANLESGAALFKKSCAACHKLYGEGGQIGPDLTGGNRANMDYLLGNVVDPSAEVPRQFTVSVIALTSGRVVTGVVVGETADVLTVQTDKDKMAIAIDDIEERTRTTKSLMPDGLLDTLTEEQVRDLFAFVMKRR